MLHILVPGQTTKFGIVDFRLSNRQPEGGWTEVVNHALSFRHPPDLCEIVQRLFTLPLKGKVDCTRHIFAICHYTYVFVPVINWISYLAFKIRCYRVKAFKISSLQCILLYSLQWEEVVRLLCCQIRPRGAQDALFAKPSGVGTLPPVEDNFSFCFTVDDYQKPNLQRKYR
jgi:hypothetical protein